MPTYTFTRTREQLALQVLEKLRVLAEGETAQDSDKARVYDAIDQRLKELHALGILWFNVDGIETELALTAGTNTVTFPLYLLYPVTVSVTDNNKDYPVEIISHIKYHEIEDKTRTSIPEQIFAYNGIGYLWPVPDKAYTLNLTYQQIADDTAASTQPDVEVSMLRALKNMVCYDLADTYSVPEPRIIRMASEANDAVKLIRLLNTPKTTRPRAKFVNY